MKIAKVRDRLTRWGWLLCGLSLIGVSAWLAHDPPIHRAASAGEISSVSMGRNLAIAGALPWALQAIGIAMTFGLLLPRRFRVSRAESTFAVAMTVAIGFVWWGLVASTFWSSDPLEMITESMFQEISLQLGGGELSDDLIRVFGAAVNPLQLRGPFSMTGLDFFVVGLSSALLLGWWTRVARWVPVSRASRNGTFVWREVGRLALAVLIWSVPMAIAAFAR